ncbi:hypothetical protein QF042_002036 [Pedobacter sp. W3I1]|uniref:hypothetical protein n=1 Tax=Pedobacter sp. W3I1 TaxID=3042291 RepID=UPI00277F7547|nr:hypothetical protein [Pedobacter sp. W3I1]MDQ0638471.1 hypothetical protein [Pedobacter sp. W3I1]
MVDINKNSAKKKHQKDENIENEKSSLEEEIITALKEKNEAIKSVKNSDHESQGSKKDNQSSGFDEWSVSWP